MDNDLLEQRRTPTNKNSSNDGLAVSSKTTKKHIRSQNNRHRKLEKLLDMSRGPHAHVTTRDLITTKISKLSCVACVQHFLCCTQSACSLCATHVLVDFVCQYFYDLFYLIVLFNSCYASSDA